jgi:hypothetical protein
MHSAWLSQGKKPNDSDRPWTKAQQQLSSATSGRDRALNQKITIATDVPTNAGTIVTGLSDWQIGCSALHATID